MFQTPMMRQYADIKKQYQDCLLFFRMGDFYELFLEDAKVGAKELDIALTSRAKGKDGRIPMAGVPYHAVDAYVSKLVKAGHKVAICEQTSPPDSSGIVDREVIRVVTPGTVLDEKYLDQKENNYIMSLVLDKKNLGIAFADISTGHFHTLHNSTTQLEHTLIDELTRLQPVECILNEDLYNNPDILKLLRTQRALNIYCFRDWPIYAQNAANVLKKHFGVETLEGFGLGKKEPHALQAASALLGYLKDTQKDKVHHFTHISVYSSQDYMLLDRSTMVNLELFATMREHERKGSLVQVLDHTQTAMGGRLLRDWVRKPLTSAQEITKRHDAVAVCVENRAWRESFRSLLRETSDIERLLARLSVGVGNARDLIHLKTTIQIILQVQKLLQTGKETELFLQVKDEISPRMQELVEYIDEYIADEPPIELKKGGLIKKGADAELDTLRESVQFGQSWLLELEQKERATTGIASLKVGYNQVFGFYIEVSKANTHLIPPQYIRKQTLVNGERYITPELKEKEEEILSAQDTAHDKEYKLYQEVVSRVLTYTPEIQHTAHAVALVDCIAGFADLAEQNTYTRATLSDTGTIHIQNGRHPVVETLLEDRPFVPNSLTLDHIENQLMMITGPNMAGKSVLIRQVALITLLNQIGSFVPAEYAELSLVDRIFVRSGASDVITSGLSTFMVEMVETAHILNHATKQSLIIMDEIGRGTSTYDGISIAWAVAEHLSHRIQAKTLFATHYHELQALEHHVSRSYGEGSFDFSPNVPKIKNYHMAIEQDEGRPIFLHTLTRGGSSHSHGVAVAQLAGVPVEVITRAQQMLHTMEHGEERWNASGENQKKEQTITSSEDAENSSFIVDTIQGLDIHSMTPLQALNTLAELRKKVS